MERFVRAVSMTSAIDGSRVGLGALFSRRELTLLLFDGAAATPDVYRRIVGIALGASERVSAYLVTRRRERPFEVPCEVAILFDDDGVGTDAEEAYVVDALGNVVLHVAPIAADPIRRLLDLELYPPFRECRFCVSFDGGSVFADFDVDEAGRVFARRVSFDGHGCCELPADAPRMNAEDSARLLAMVESGALGGDSLALLRRYFAVLAGIVWDDALREYALID